MNCLFCENKAVVKLQHGRVCTQHFLSYFEKKVFQTIKKYRLIDRKDKVGVATSGGKDSTTALYLTKKYFQKANLPKENLFALGIDEGIKRHRQESLKNLKKFCKEKQIKLKIVKVKDNFQTTIDQSAQKIRKLGKKPCTVCGIWRRYLLNKYARKYGATKLVTGHNLDDEAQGILMNQFKANTTLTASLGPLSRVKEHQLFVPRIKPLYFCSNEEVELYTKLKKWDLDYCHCLYAEEGYRFQIKKMLNQFEEKYPGTKEGIVKSYLEILPLLKEKEKKALRGEIKICQECGEPANQKICNACKLKNLLK